MTMTRDKIGDAIHEADRFLKMARKARDRLRDEGNQANLLLITGCKEIAAMKRASMDLTRALSELRR